MSYVMEAAISIEAGDFWWGPRRALSSHSSIIENCHLLPSTSVSSNLTYAIQKSSFYIQTQNISKCRSECCIYLVKWDFWHWDVQYWFLFRHGFYYLPEALWQLNQREEALLWIWRIRRDTTTNRQRSFSFLGQLCHYSHPSASVTQFIATFPIHMCTPPRIELGKCIQCIRKFLVAFLP